MSISEIAQYVNGVTLFRITRENANEVLTLIKT